MKRLKNDQRGLIPLLIAAFAIMIGVIYFAFTRVASNQ
jgi:hypothetical protein